jgi:large subunit ribosomal protein L31
MQESIHPDYKEIKATCSCGNVIEIKSTLAEDLQLDVCSECHPFYTGKQKLVDTGGRVDKFRKRFGSKSKAAVSSEAPAEEVVVEEAVVEEAPAEEVVVEEAVVEEAPAEEVVVEEAPAKKKAAKKTKKK